MKLSVGVKGPDDRVTRIGTPKFNTSQPPILWRLIMDLRFRRLIAGGEPVTH